MTHVHCSELSLCSVWNCLRIWWDITERKVNFSYRAERYVRFMNKILKASSLVLDSIVFMVATISPAETGWQFLSEARHVLLNQIYVVKLKLHPLKKDLNSKWLIIFLPRMLQIFSLVEVQNNFPERSMLLHVRWGITWKQKWFSNVIFVN